MSGNQHQGHDHGHAHPEPTYNKAFLIAISANSLFIILQVVYATLAHSTSLLADAVHNLGDVLALIFAFIATQLIMRKPTAKTTYGLKKTSILAALLNGFLLIFSCGIIVSQAVYQLFFPREVAAVAVMIVAGIGIVVNGATALLFAGGSDDLNIRGAYLHLLYDALISIGVVLSAVVLYWTNWLWVDPLVGLLIAIVILKGTWSLLADSFRLIIDGVPGSISLVAVQDFFLKKPGVKAIHDLHIWAMSTKENALSVHVYMPNESLTDEMRFQWLQQLEHEFGINHVTIQVEKTNTHCMVVC